MDVNNVYLKKLAHMVTNIKHDEEFIVHYVLVSLDVPENMVWIIHFD